MPITDYHFENRIFFARESGQISKEDAQMWSDQLKEVTQSCPLPVVALVDALDVSVVHHLAQVIFQKSSFFENLLAVVVATNVTVSLQAQTIGLLGKRGHTRIFDSLEKAFKDAEDLIAEYQVAPE